MLLPSLAINQGRRLHTRPWVLSHILASFKTKPQMGHSAREILSYLIAGITQKQKNKTSQFMVKSNQICSSITSDTPNLMRCKRLVIISFSNLLELLFIIFKKKITHTMSLLTSKSVKCILLVCSIICPHCASGQAHTLQQLNTVLMKLGFRGSIPRPLGSVAYQTYPNLGSV